jgi:hypothetical protein
MELLKAVQIGQQGQLARHFSAKGVKIDNSEDISNGEIIFMGETGQQITEAMVAGKKVVFDSAETWDFHSSDLMKLSNLKGSFHANLQLLNATKLDELVSEITTLGKDGFKLGKVSVTAYDLIKD